MLNMRQGGHEDEPIVAWHQGGPGGSSTEGGMIEMNYFQVDGTVVKMHTTLICAPFRFKRRLSKLT